MAAAFFLFIVDQMNWRRRNNIASPRRSRVDSIAIPAWSKLRYSLIGCRLIRVHLRVGGGGQYRAHGEAARQQVARHDRILAIKKIGRDGRSLGGRSARSDCE